MSSEAAAVEPGGQGGLERRLNLTDATMIVVGSMIGSGIFLTSAESARLVGAPGWLLLAWALAGVLTITGALSCAELAAMWPRAGGQYVFLREAYGPATGFLFGWSLFLVVQTGTIAAVAVAFGRFLGVLWPAVAGDRYLVQPVALGGSGYALSLSTEQLAAVGCIGVLTLINTFGLEIGRRVQNLFTVTKTAALMALIGVGLSLGWNRSAALFTSSWWHPTLNGWSPDPVAGAAGGFALVLLLGRAMVGPLFSQSAWNNVTFAGGEVTDPERTLARSLLRGCGLVVALYLLANLAYVVTLPLAEIQQAPQNRVAVAAMERIFGAPGGLLMAAAILISTFGCNNGLILAGARVSYAMARDGLFLSHAGRLNRARVPAWALAAQGIWAGFLTLPRTVTTDSPSGAPRYGNVYTQLLEYTISADLVFYGLMVAAVLVLRQTRPEIPRPWRTPGYPWVPLGYLVIATVLVVDLAWLAPATSGIGYLIVLSGIPVYALSSRGAGSAR